MMKYNKDPNVLYGPDLLYEPSKEGGLGYEIFHCLNRNKGKIAQEIINTGEVDTYDELLERCVITASFLLDKKLKKDDLVCMCSGNNVNSIVPFIAANFVGVHYVSLEPSIPKNDLIYILGYLQPKLMFVTGEVKEKIEECLIEANYECEVALLNDSKKGSVLPNAQITTTKKEFNPVLIKDTKETAIIILSSGTTGKPKGIYCNHYSLLAQTFNMEYYMHHRGTITFSNFSYKFSDDQNPKYLIYSPMYWVTGILFSLGSFFCGGTRVLGANFNGAEAWRAAKKHRPDTIFLPPGQVHELCLHGSTEKPNTSVEGFILGGGLVTSKHVEAVVKCFPNAKLVQAYGQTEHTGTVLSIFMGDPKDILLQRAVRGSCGKVIMGVKVKIVDLESGKTCGINQPGELRAKNKCMMNGYHKIDSSSEFDSEGWLKSGDLAYYDENGFFYILDRLKNLLLYTVYNIRPSVIEEVILQHDAVFECLVIGKPHLSDNEHPMGVVVLKEEYKGKISEDELVSYVNDKVPSDRYKIRAGIKFVNKILKTPNGKIKRYEMKRLIIDGKI